jgi:very-short-patch-repair endonuclease
VALARIVAVHHQLRGEHTFSHTSAALLHGLTTWRTAAKVEIYQPTSRSGHGASHLLRHVPMPPPADRTTVVGLPVTTLARTAWDCMCAMPAGEAIVVADAALHAGVTATELDAFARRGGRGHSRAARILAVADAGAESAPESMCRYRLLVAGYPPPTTQIPVVRRFGTYFGDLGWPEWKVLIEYDGRSKYEENATETFIAEKRRHDALVEKGWRALRVTKEDLASRRGFETRVAELVPEAAAALRPRRELRW